MEIQKEIKTPTHHRNKSRFSALGYDFDRKDVLHVLLLILYLLSSTDEPFEVDWSVVFLLIAGNLVIILMEIFERVRSPSSLLSLMTMTANTPPFLPRNLIADSDALPIFEISPEFREASIFILFGQKRLFLLFGLVHRLPASTVSFLDYLPRSLALLLAFKMFSDFFGAFRTSKGPDVSAAEAMRSFRLFNFVEVVFYALIALQCRPVEWIVHRFLMTTIINAALLFFMQLARLLLRAAPPELRPLFEKLVQL